MDLQLKYRGLSILARREPITEDQWFLLLEARQKLMGKHLREMSLETLGEIPFINDYFHDHSLKRDLEWLEIMGDNRFSLETRGVFPLSGRAHSRTLVSRVEWSPETGADRETARRGGLMDRSSTERFWGLTRDSVWIAIEVFITRHHLPYKYDDRTEQVARAKRLIIKECAPRELCVHTGRTPQQIWQRLGEVAREWVEHRRYLLANAESLTDTVELEEAALSVVPS